MRIIFVNKLKFFVSLVTVIQVIFNSIEYINCDFEFYKRKQTINEKYAKYNYKDLECEEYMLNNMKYNNKNQNIEVYSKISLKEVSYCYYNANSPNEDRFNIEIIPNNIDGEINSKESFMNMSNNFTFLSVLDGHGGYILSEYANIKLSKYFTQYIKSMELLYSKDSFLKNNNNKRKNNTNGSDITRQLAIINTLKLIHNMIEDEFKQLSLHKIYKEKDFRYSKVGSCVLIAIIHNSKLYISNIGDEKARLFINKKIKGKDRERNDFFSVKLMHRHNAAKEREQKIILNRFQNESFSGLFKCMSRSVCYLKGRLQLTRALGDFYLKYKEFDFYDLNLINGKPYVDSTPELSMFDLNVYLNHNEDDIDENKNENNSNIRKMYDSIYLVLASDGVGDFISSKTIIQYLNKHVLDIESKESKDKVAISDNDNSKIEFSAINIFEMVINKVVQKYRLKNKDAFFNIPLKQRRQRHDDTTVIVAKLK